MKEKITIGYIGLGRRGLLVLDRAFAQMSDVWVKTVCDLDPVKLETAKAKVLERGGYEPILTTNYKDIINDPEIDAVIIMSGWSGRPQMAMEAMRAGKYAGVEVGCADNLEECFELVDTYEETGVPVMMLENCCYGRREMMLLKMIKEGLFGEVVHLRGGYCHYLNDMELLKDIGQHYRLKHYIEENRENYPTHELGPISKMLGINRGNRMVSLVSVASKARGLQHSAKTKLGDDHELANTDYKQGDIVNTIITCAGGETILLTLDTTLVRSHYSRNLSVRGTKAMSDEERHVVFLEGMEEEISNNEKEMFEKYDHPLHEEYERVGVKEGHGGMDWLVCRAFVESVKNGTNTPIDAYDAAAWLAIGPLSAKSISLGGMSVEVPDFTKGKWQNREPALTGKYSLDEICVDKDTPIIV